jgi:hypothetical protein
MARLRIGVEQLGAEGFRLELAGAGGVTNVIALAPGGGIQGRYEHDEASIGLKGVRASTLALSELSWALAHGHLSGAGRMHDVEIEAVIAIGEARAQRPGFVGMIRAAAVEATVDLTLGDIVLHGAHVRVDGFELVADADGKVDLRVGSASASTIRGTVGPFSVHADDVALPDLATVQAGALRLEEITVGSLRVDLPSFAREPTATPTSDTGEAPPPSGVPHLAFVDHLRGHLNVDLTVDVSLPIIGGREATHRFRIPIDEGVVELRALSRSLSTLESLVLGFAVRGDRLVLEKDIPLLPFDNQPLVSWQLDAEGLELAARDRVRLSTLLRPQLAASAKEPRESTTRDKGKGVQLRRIDAEEIDVVLAVPAPFSLELAGGRIDFGGEGRPSLGELRVQGSVGHQPLEPPEGRVAASAKEIHLAASDVQLGTRRLQIGAAHLQSVHEVVLNFVGLRPASLSARGGGLTLEKLEISR